MRRKLTVSVLGLILGMSMSMTVCAEEPVQTPAIAPVAVESDVSQASDAAVVSYDPYASYVFTDPILAAARQSWIEKKRLSVSRVSAIDDNVLMFADRDDWRQWLEYISSYALVPKGGSSAVDRHGYVGTNETKLDFNATYGVDYRKYSNAFDLMMGILVQGGINPDFDHYTMEPTKVNDWTIRYHFTSTDDQPVYNTLKTKVNDIASVKEQSVRISVDYDTRYNTYQFSFVDAEVRYKTANCPGNIDNDKDVYVCYSFGAR